MRCGAVLLSLLGLACGDPARDQAVAALGPEDPAVPPGPLHRPGQPCVACHSRDGSASAFLVAGTVYLKKGSREPYDTVSVILTDAARTTYTATTNCAGNFFVREGESKLRYPLFIDLVAGDVTREMSSAIYREGSCAACHAEPVGPASAGPVYLVENPTFEVPPPSRCR
jgi:mono/diheme cytochrome c family protein